MRSRGFVGVLAASFRELKDVVLRYRASLQLRHRESQRVFDDLRNTCSVDWNARVRGAGGPGDRVSRTAGHSGNVAWRDVGGTGICFIPYLYRGAGAGRVLYFVSEFVVIDKCDCDSGGGDLVEARAVGISAAPEGALNLKDDGIAKAIP